MRTETVRLLEDGRIEELAALLDGASGNQQTVDVLKSLLHNTTSNDNAQSIADARYEIRWEKSAASGLRCGSRRGICLAPHRR